VYTAPVTPANSQITVDGYDAVYRVECGGSIAFVALHALVRNRTFGGIRIRHYPDESAALSDALDLAKAMSRKVVMAGIEGGGAKSVLLAPAHSRRERAVSDLAAFIESLAGRYMCGGDLGFTTADEQILRAGTQYVACGDLAGWTARSVGDSIAAVTTPEVVVVQGLGAVGRPLAETLRDRGARVVAADIDTERCDGFEITNDAYGTPCDVFSPCGPGGLLDRGAIGRLSCRVICGGANNPLADVTEADHLHDRGILYVPDFVANSGATIRGAGAALGEDDQTEARMAAVGPLVEQIMAAAKDRDCSPHHVAVEMADARLARLRS